MKKLSLILTLMLIAWAGMTFLPACNLFNNDDDEDEDVGVTETLFTNPEDGQIIELDSAGHKVIYIGEKDADGMPTKITQAIVDGEDLTPESRTVIDFDDEGRATSLSSELNGFMTLDYVSDTQVVIVYTLPDNEGTYQLTFNPDNPEKMGDCGCPGNEKNTDESFVMRSEHQLAFNPPKPEEKYSPPGYKSGKALKGNLYTLFNQTANPVTGNTILGMYETSEGKTGAIKVEEDEPGHFNYYYPSNPAPPPPPGLGDRALSLLNKVCYGAIPLALAKHAICFKFINPIAIAKCEVVLTAYVWICRINTARRVGTYTYDVYTAEEVQLVFTSMHPSLPTKRAERKIKPSQGFLPEINIFYDAFAVIGTLYTSPADPTPSQGYTIYTTILNGIPNVDQVKLSMTGSDGYTKEQTFTLDASSQCSMSIPGAEQGVKDQITASVVNMNPQPGQSKTIFIYF